MDNYNRGLRALYHSALSGSIVNSDTILRAIDSDKDAATESLGFVSRFDSLRQNDREIVAEITKSFSDVETLIDSSLPEKLRDLTEATSRYVIRTEESELEALISSIESFKSSLETLDEQIDQTKHVVEEVYDDLKSSSAKQILSGEFLEKIDNLSMHVTQLFVILLTTEGSAQQCKMTY